ncbi:MAG: hypothetical protein M3R53_08330 [Candidatus Eremiobacteraeota bacterium]|nr:hypothetical protein [Candidatus Eremiobacteraeota bacterium]
MQVCRLGDRDNFIVQRGQTERCAHRPSSIISAQSHEHRGNVAAFAATSTAATVSPRDRSREFRNSVAHDVAYARVGRVLEK